MERYDNPDDEGNMNLCSDGDWVKFSDYDALRTDRDAHADLSERIKVALNRIGTKDSYVEWAKECRKAYDDLQTVTNQRDELVMALERVIADCPQYGIITGRSDCRCSFCEANRLLTRIKGQP
jgi:hypothetical protein